MVAFVSLPNVKNDWNKAIQIETIFMKIFGKTSFKIQRDGSVC